MTKVAMVDEAVLTQAQADARSFRDYRVVAKNQESALITSFELEPVDEAALVDWQAGQYLVFRLSIQGQGVLRNYSMSAEPDGGRRLRIAVKREPAPVDSPDVPAGLVSNYLHEQVQVGDILNAAGPMGEFVLDENSQRPVVLLSGGVGITPMLSMLHRLVHTSSRRVHFIHACDSGELHAFAEEVVALAAKRDGVHVHFCYRNPSEADRQQPCFSAEGLLSKTHLQSWLVLDDYDFYLCGPTGFMQANWRLLRELGVAKERIRYEFFGPATLLEEDTSDDSVVADTVVEAPQQEASTAEPVVSANSSTHGDTVQFASHTEVIAWDPDSPSLLDFAEAQGLSPDFNCRSGLCNTCMCDLVSGEVEYFEEPLDPPPAGKLLLCCAKPKGPVVVSLPEA